MTIPLWCLFIVAFMPYLIAGVGSYYRTRQFGTLDNNHPRIQYAKLEGAGARAWAAQKNAWEALALFGAVVLIAEIGGADPDQAGIAALIFLATRILHPFLYIANLATLRSVVFTVGLLSCVFMVTTAME